MGNHLVPIFVILPLVGAFLNSILGKRIRWVPDVLTNIVTIGLFIFSVFSIFAVSKYGILVYKVGSWIPPIGIAMVLDGLTSFMLVTVNLVAFLVAL